VEFSIKIETPDRTRTDCLVVGIYEKRKPSPAAVALDKTCGGYLKKILQQGDMEGHSGSTLLLHQIPHVAAGRVLLVGLGKEEEFGEKAYRGAVKAAMATLNGTGAGEACFCLASLPVKQRPMDWRAEQLALVAQEACYRFDRLKSRKEKSPLSLKKIALLVDKHEQAEATTGLARGKAIGQGMELAKNLANLPGNHCTPTHLAQAARSLAKSHGLKVQVLGQAELEKLGMGSFLSVTRGSVQPPKLIVLQYLGHARKTKPVALVGKGITFDSGGISLKPGEAMDEMKYDMSGAASVLGTLKAAAELKLPLNVVGIIPTCENMPDGNASKPGDVVESMSGQTIEILNTDAEGRLILCDALTYTERFDPACVVDIATLTGACVIALGHVATGLLANDDQLAASLLRAGDEAGDRAWQLPLWEDYQEQLKSNFADMANIGGRPAGTITAACFLSRFTKKFQWAHLDIAGTAWVSGKDKGATGRPVPLLTHFLISKAAGR
jgi:leucyl aminopeptidase